MQHIQPPLAGLKEGMTIRYGLHQAAKGGHPVSRSTVERERRRNPEFRELYEEAVEDVADQLEDIAIGRARAGSDSLLQTLLRAFRPSKYLVRQGLEHTGPVGGPLTTVEIPTDPARTKEVLQALEDAGYLVNVAEEPKDG